jgi:adenylyltransferase/sulfurtransferase
LSYSRRRTKTTSNSGTQPPLRPEQFDRYRRHLSLPDFGLEGQQKLLESRVLLIGAGGLGCPLALYLSAAGVGQLGLVDDDVVDASNLQRQVLYATGDVGRPKVEVASERIRALNPDVEVVTHQLRLDSSNALEIFEPYDVIVDGTDNFPTRYLSNDACVLLGKPNVYGSIFRFEGQATVFDSREGPCYRCLFPAPPPPGAAPSCEEGGVLGVLPGIIAMLQATETVKLLAGIGTSLVGRLLLYDALHLEFSEFKLRKDPKCPVCGDEPTITELIDYVGFCGLPQPGGEAVAAARPVSAFDVSQRMRRGEDLLLLDVRDKDEFERARIEGSTLIPVAELGDRLAELEAYRERPVVVHCHHGPRSRRACELLIERGFSCVEELSGGIEAWSVTVDPTVPRY